jgi:hypothetical protein
MATDIHSKGSPSAQVWVVIEQPYAGDKDKRFNYSCGYGYVFDKMMREAGIPDYYVVARRPDLDDRNCFSIIENALNHYQPPLIIAIEEAGKHLCVELEKKFTQKKNLNEKDSDIEKYAGSLLISPKLNYPHYIIPSFAPDTIIKDWSLRDIVVSLDLGKCRSELDYFRQHGKLQPLPERILKYEIEDYDELSSYLDRFSQASILSNDIETVYTNTKSMYYPHPGYPVTIGLADSKDFGISFNLFRESKSETMDLWRRLSQILCRVPQLGQNFFNFDAFRYESLGFRIPLEKVQDTLIRHHILWPELPHKLQFLTRQYTRQPYYKDEGKMWNMKDMCQLRRYNCLDVCVTMEVYLQQELEFNERPYLR